MCRDGEMANTADLKSVDVSLEGSSPSLGTTYKYYLRGSTLQMWCEITADELGDPEYWYYRFKKSNKIPVARVKILTEGKNEVPFDFRVR